jgi:hypothetical protein
VLSIVVVIGRRKEDPARPVPDDPEAEFLQTISIGV